MSEEITIEESQYTNRTDEHTEFVQFVSVPNVAQYRHCFKDSIKWELLTYTPIDSSYIQNYLIIDTTHHDSFGH